MNPTFPLTTSSSRKLNITLYLFFWVKCLVMNIFRCSANLFCHVGKQLYQGGNCSLQEGKACRPEGKPSLQSGKALLQEGKQFFKGGNTSLLGGKASLQSGTLCRLGAKAFAYKRLLNRYTDRWLYYMALSAYG